jgi:hypothetical protein
MRHNFGAQKITSSSSLSLLTVVVIVVVDHNGEWSIVLFV